MRVHDWNLRIWMAAPALIVAGGAATIFAVAAAPTSAQDNTRATQTRATQTMTSKTKAAAGKQEGAGVRPAAAGRSDAVHRSAIVIDTHADTPQRFLDEQFDLGDPLKGGEFNLESARKGNLGAEFFSIWVEPEQYKGHYARRTLELIDAVKQQAAKHKGQMELVTSAEGIE